MKIHAALYTLKPTYRFGISREVRTEYRTILLRLEYNGIRGYGEAFPSARYEKPAEENFAILEASRLNDMETYLDEFRPDSFQRWIEQATGRVDSLCAGLSAVYYDYHARRLGISCTELVGSKGLEAPETSMTIGLDELDVMRKKVEEAAGYPVLKVKLGTDHDQEIIEAIRDRTDRPVRVDANEAWTPEEALGKIRWLSGQNVEFVEQPIPAHNYGAMRWLRARSPLPLLADEDCLHPEDLPQIMDCFDGINIKLAKCGGVTPALKMIHTAHIYGKTIMLGCMVESSAGIAPAAALAPQVDYIDLDGNLLLSNDPFHGPKAEGGEFPDLTALGQGVEPQTDIEWEPLVIQ